MRLLLDNRMQSAVRQLVLAEPEAGSLLPSSVTSSLERLVGWDAFGVVEADQTGCVVRSMTLPDLGPSDPQVCDGPLPTGLWHDATAPDDERAAAETGIRDLIRLGFGTRSGTVVQLFFARQVRDFDEEDMAVLTMLEPAIGRLVRSSTGEVSVEALSPSERRVLTLIATGATNRQAAEELFVTVHTVRKHLENAYRKLGVTNRTQAALKLRGGE